MKFSFWGSILQHMRSQLHARGGRETVGSKTLTCHLKSKLNSTVKINLNMTLNGILLENLLQHFLGLITQTPSESFSCFHKNSTSLKHYTNTT